MNLKTAISIDLYAAISKPYESGNYSHSILDAIHFLGSLLREKSDLDVDGVSLVGAALGGKTPRLKINNLQTRSERDEQAGFEQILRGIYMGIRNPRSHKQLDDDQADADAIILFIDFLLRKIGESRPPFTVPEFLDCVFDPYFAHEQRYADLRVSEVPSSKLLDAITEVFRNRGRGTGKSLPFIFSAARERLSEAELHEFLAVVSADMLTVQDTSDIQRTLLMLSRECELWSGIAEAARLRIENVVVDSITDGACEYETNKVRRDSGWLGAWARCYLEYFSSQRKVMNALRTKLGSDGAEGQRYVLIFFGHLLPSLCASSWDARLMQDAIVSAVRSDAETDPRREFLELLDRFIWDYPEEWRQHIIDETSDLRPQGSDDEIPF